MEGYKKYRTIHRISYIAFFFYLIIISIGGLGQKIEAGAIPYHIIIPFAIYCAIAIGMEILIRKEIRAAKSAKKKDEQEERYSGDIPSLSKT